MDSATPLNDLSGSLVNQRLFGVKGRQLGIAPGVFASSGGEDGPRIPRSPLSRYGKGRGHPAQLDLGDCFACAISKNYRTVLLFKDEDFDKTDIRPASRSR